MNTPSNPSLSALSVLSNLGAALAALVGYAPSMREQLDGQLL